eukprot:Rhum_TRINITY_DN14423_c8_g1::Rhum_TRINITY_DN14423_c8_g1_i2::g.88985::m.88985
MTTFRGAAMVYYMILMRFRALQRSRRHKDMVAGALLRTTSRGVLKLYYDMWAAFRTMLKARQRRLMASDILLAHTDRGTGLICWRKWQRFVAKQKSDQKRFNLCLQLSDANGSALRAQYWRKLEGWMTGREERELSHELSRLQEENADLTRVLQTPHMSDEEVEAALRAAEDELNELYHEEEGLAQHNHGLRQEMYDVRREINAETLRHYGAQFGEEDLTSQVMHLLKARAVHCDFDFERLTISRQEGKGYEQQLYDKGVRTVKKAIEKENNKKGLTKRETFIENGEWVLADFGLASGNLLPKKALMTVACGVREMVVAYDMMTFDKKRMMRHSQEVLVNAVTLIEMLKQCNQVRATEGDSTERGSRGRKRSSSKKKKVTSEKQAWSRGKSGDAARRVATPYAETGGGSSRRKTSSKKKASASAAGVRVSRDSSSSSKKKGSKKKTSSKKRGSSTSGSRSRGGMKPAAKKSGVRAASPRPRRAASPRPLTGGLTGPGYVPPGQGTRRMLSRSPAPKRSTTPRAGTSSTGPVVKKTSKKSKGSKKRVSKGSKGSKKKKTSKKSKGSKKKVSKRASGKKGSKKRVSKKSGRVGTRSPAPGLGRSPLRARSRSAGASARAGAGATGLRRQVRRRDARESAWLGMNIDVGPSQEGLCRIDEIIPGGPAAMAGIEGGDILVAFGDAAVTDVATFQDAFVRFARVGVEVPFVVARDDGSQHEGVFFVMSQQDKIDMCNA